MFATTMTLSQFLNQPTTPDSIYNNLSQFQQHINDFNSIRDSIQSQIDYSNNILNGSFQVQQPQSVQPNPIPANFQLMPNGLKDKLDTLNTLDKIKESLDKIGSFLDYITHPTKIIEAVIIWSINSSYSICLTVAILAVIFYVAGQKKAIKYVPISFTIYVLLQALGGCIK